MNKIIHGDCLTTLRTLQDKSVHCVITSPPYWQLRDYLWTGQWGLEKTYQEYLEHLWQLMDEIYRVLRDDGTVWINLGDTYGGNNSMASNNGRAGFGNPREQIVNRGIAKCLMLIPHRFAIGCIDRGWIVRNDIIWAKRNGMPESCQDRFSKKHEFIFFMVKSQKYYFDLDGVRDKAKIGMENAGAWNGDRNLTIQPISEKNTLGGCSNPLGKNPGSVSDFWDIPTQPSSEKHYATFNTQLIDKPIIAGCPQYVCKKCGKARESVYEQKEIVRTPINDYQKNTQTGGQTTTFNGGAAKKVIGLTDCGCNAGFEGGVILDPFCGTATTLYRAAELGRQYIGIEGSQEYIKIAEERMRNLHPSFL